MPEHDCRACPSACRCRGCGQLPVSFEELLQPANATYTPVAAIVDAWAPTMGAPTLAALLFGQLNRWGKSVLTVYPHEYQNQVSLFSFDM